jgi:testis-specific serine kinase
VTHEHIVQIHSILQMGPYMCVFMEYCPYGDLLERVKNYGALCERRSKLYFGQLVSALSYLHEIDVSHRGLQFYFISLMVFVL